MSFGQVITRIDNSDFDVICKQLKVENVFNLNKQVADTLVDIIEGYKRARHSTELIGDLYFFKFVVTQVIEKKIDALNLPKDTNIVGVFHDDKAYLISNLEVLKEDDVITLITKQEQIEILSEKFDLSKKLN